MILLLALPDTKQLLRYRIPIWDSANTESIQDLVEILGFILLVIT